MTREYAQLLLINAPIGVSFEAVQTPRGTIIAKGHIDCHLNFHHGV
jgi:hypothetical protein